MRNTILPLWLYLSVVDQAFQACDLGRLVEADLEVFAGTHGNLVHIHIQADSGSLAVDDIRNIQAQSLLAIFNAAAQETKGDSDGLALSDEHQFSRRNIQIANLIVTIGVDHIHAAFGWSSIVGNRRLRRRRLINRLLGCLVGGLIDRLLGSLVSRLIGRLLGSLISRLIGRLLGRP